MWQWRPFENLVDVDIIIARIDDHQSKLFADEIEYIKSSVESRVREFAAGRSLARSVMGSRDIHPKSIPVGAGGQPLWPQGICGSLTHSGPYVGVAIGSCGRNQGVGLDIESLDSADSLHKEQILSADEISRLTEAPAALHLLTVFSAKESVFKALYPLAGEDLEFSDLDVEVDNNEFRARRCRHKHSAGIICDGRGFISMSANLVATVFVVPEVA